MISFRHYNKFPVLLISFFLLTSNFLSAAITLPYFFSDNMVIQRQTDAAIWGWAKANSTVQITGSWNRKKYTVKRSESVV